MDVEDVKAVVRTGSGRRLAEHEVARAPLELLAEALQQRIVELAHLDLVEQIVADPVSVHDPRIERIRDVVGAGDELEIGQRAGELLEVPLQATIDNLLDGVIEKEAVLITAAVAEPVRHESVADEAHHPVEWPGG